MQRAGERGQHEPGAGQAQIGAQVFSSLTFFQLTLISLFAPALAAGAVSGERERQTFDVLLTGSGDKKIQVIKVVRAATGLGLKEAKALVDELKPVKEGIERDEADKLKAELEEAGATVELK